MMTRLLLTILVACLAMPSLAAPAHCAPPASHAAAMESGYHGDRPDQPATQRKGHDCIGCAVPATPAPPLAATPFHPRATQRWSNTAAPPATATAPETPPPRA